MDNPNKNDYLFEEFLNNFNLFADNISRIHLMGIVNSERLQSEGSFIPPSKISEWENYRKENRGVLLFEKNLGYSSYDRV